MYCCRQTHTSPTGGITAAAVMGTMSTQVSARAGYERTNGSAPPLRELFFDAIQK